MASPGAYHSSLCGCSLGGCSLGDCCFCGEDFSRRTPLWVLGSLIVWAEGLPRGSTARLWWVLARVIVGSVGEDCADNGTFCSLVVCSDSQARVLNSGGISTVCVCRPRKLDSMSLHTGGSPSSADTYEICAAVLHLLYSFVSII